MTDTRRVVSSEVGETVSVLRAGILSQNTYTRIDYFLKRFRFNCKRHPKEGLRGPLFGCMKPKRQQSHRWFSRQMDGVFNEHYCESPAHPFCMERSAKDQPNNKESL